VLIYEISVTKLKRGFWNGSLQVHLPGPSVERIGYKLGKRPFWTGKKLQYQWSRSTFFVLFSTPSSLPVVVVVRRAYGVIYSS
jgi:hypothetical protein